MSSWSRRGQAAPVYGGPAAADAACVAVAFSYLAVWGYFFAAASPCRVHRGRGDVDAGTHFEVVLSVAVTVCRSGAVCACCRTAGSLAVALRFWG